MQISRHLLMTCAVAAFLTPTLAHAFDNEAQIRARQALEEKIKQIDAQAPPATSVPPAVAKPEPKPAATNPKPAASTVTPEIFQPVTSAPPISVRSTDSATADKLNDALHQKMRETESEPVAMPAPAQPPEKPKKPAPAAVVKAPPVQPNSTPSTPTFAPIPTPANVVHPALPETPTAAQAPVTASTPAFAPIPESSNTVHPKLPEMPTPEPTANQNQGAPLPILSLPALTGPPSSLSPAQQQKLDALLQQYRADQLTPQQYHEQRAKILSEP